MLPSPRRAKGKAKGGFVFEGPPGDQDEQMEVDLDSDNECIAATAEEKKTKEKKDKKDKKAVKAPKLLKPAKPTAPAGDEDVDEAADEAGDEAVVVASVDDGSDIEDAGAGGDKVEDAGAGGDEDQSDDGMPLSGAGKRNRRKAITDQLIQQQGDDHDCSKETLESHAY